MTLREEIKQLLTKHAMANARSHKRGARKEPVIRRLLAERRDLIQSIDLVQSLADEVIEEVNKIPLSELESDSERDSRTGKRHLLEHPALSPLPNAEKYERVVTRFAPNPDCVLHVGSLRALILSHDYARKYQGVFILRFDDSDPRLKKSALAFYDIIKSDMRWLGCAWDLEFILSDRLEEYYRIAQVLIEKGNAYPCTCSSARFSSLVASSEACPCRNLPTEVLLDRWPAMLSRNIPEGSAVVRIKTDLSHPNPAVRDWPALRIIDPFKHPHPRVGSKYSVWPLYNFASAIDDHLMGVTHIIRGKEHLVNMERQLYLYKYLDWTYPQAVHYGRLKLEDGILSKSAILRMVEEGQASGFDDPRLPTIQALRRRGFLPETLRTLIHQIGLRPVDARLSWENIHAINRKMLDPVANRYFFVADPIKIRVSGGSHLSAVKLAIHPDFPDRGVRTLRPTFEKGEMLLEVSRDDLKTFQKGRSVRLIHLLTVEALSSSEEEVVAKALPNEGPPKDAKVPLVQWLPARNSIPAEVIIPTGEKRHGRGESALTGVAQGEIVQLVRVGFGRVEEKTEDFVRIVLSS